ncbi:zinc transporter ZupT [Halosquirtibacter xylanolyticus]|uniref:zinc transporter ZupT n=1 Tax=Halosquirtibacter xylanolyticus TaxID=3374599 RepID=UPI003748FF15|nr:zinc transporter ZupT [Prolixibacteraceae bacterium]
MELSNNFMMAFGLTLFAGLSTGIGSLIAFVSRQTNTKLLSVALGFSAGVMIYVSFVEILPEGVHSLQEHYTDKLGEIYGILAFFGGILIIALIDKLIPSFENPHEIKKIEEMDDASKAKDFRKLYRMGIMTALAVGVHNFPEGLATFISALNDPSLGVAIAVAIAIHNIPEGIAVSVPIYYATKSRSKAFWLSFLSGLAEPVGALIGYVLILPFVNADNLEVVMGVVLCSIAGVMVFISLDELLPTAEEYGEHHLSIYGLVAGMAVMAISLLLF